MNYDDMPLSPSKLTKDKEFVKLHKIKKLESRIVTLVSLLFAAKTDESKRDLMAQLRAANDQLAELECDD